MQKLSAAIDVPLEATFYTRIQIYAFACGQTFSLSLYTDGMTCMKAKQRAPYFTTRQRRWGSWSAIGIHGCCSRFSAGPDQTACEREKQTLVSQAVGYPRMLTVWKAQLQSALKVQALIYPDFVRADFLFCTGFNLKRTMYNMMRDTYLIKVDIFRVRTCNSKK